MLQSALQAISTIVLPHPSFKVTPSQPDPIYYTGTSFRGNHYKLQTSRSNFNVSTTKFGETPRTPRRRKNISASSSICSISRSNRNSTCCCSCNCPYEHSSKSPNVELGLLTAVASSLLESPSPRRSPSTAKSSRRHSTGFWNSSPLSRHYKDKHIPQSSQYPSASDDKRLRRTSRRILSGFNSNEMAGFDSFDSAFKTTTPRQLEFLDTLKRNSMMHELDSSVSSCSSFDPSDNECNYPSTSHMTAPPSLSSPVSLPSRTQTRSSQAFSDNFPPAFELSPILEDSSAFEDVDDILAYYSDSPVLGRGNESQDYSGFAFDEADWDPEPMFDAETEPKFHVTDADENPAGSRRVRRMSFVLKSTVHGDDSLFDATDDEAECNTFKDLLQPPALTLTFPTPEILGPTLPDPFPLVIEPNQLSPFASIPQTPPSSVRRNALGDITNTLVPPTPLPSLPRCTSCRFGFAFDVTGSTDMLPRPIGNTKPCGKCQAQWDRCRKWYGKRGWEVDGKAEQTTTGPDEVDETGPSRAKGFKRASQRLSQIVEGVFTSDRTSRRISADLSPRGTVSKRSSKRISFMNWGQQKVEDLGNSNRSDRGCGAEDVAFPARAAEVPPAPPFDERTSSADTAPKGIWKTKFMGVFPKSKAMKKEDSERKRRRSFLDLGTSGIHLRTASHGHSYAGRA